MMYDYNAPLDDLLKESRSIYSKNFSTDTSFERAIFLSWYCSKGDCKFCYMSTQKNKIKKVPVNLAKRRAESLIVEALLCRELGWNIEFLSGGYDSYNDEELLRIVKYIHMVYKKKLWLNIGLLNDFQIEMLKPYTEGVCGSIECLDKQLHDHLCPSKPIEPIADMLDMAKTKGLKRGMTIIIGLGEKIEDFILLKEFVIRHNIDRITFYRLNPHPGTIFTKGPDTDYYARWIALTRIAFPKIEIIAGSWVDNIDEIHLLLDAGANNITKFPSTGLFGTGFASRIEQQMQISERNFIGTLTSLPDIDWDLQIDLLDIPDALKEKCKIKIRSYLEMMSTNRQRENAVDSAIDE